MSLASSLRERGLIGSAQCALVVGRNHYCRWRTRTAPRYASPTAAELAQIERSLAQLGVPVVDHAPAPAAFAEFMAAGYFPADYHGGHDSGVWDEKLLEHWLSAELLGLMSYRPEDLYVDVAACSSPWVRVLRERHGLAAVAIDLAAAGAEYRDLPYYRVENATATSFVAGSVRGASLHCAYEMFAGDDDVGLLGEMARILAPGGKAVIAPLYMHTHYCAYATPEYYGRGYSDPQAKEYLRGDCWGVRTSRKYDAAMLLERVLRPIEALGMRYRLLALRNKERFGRDIYCHFILEVSR